MNQKSKYVVLFVAALLFLGGMILLINSTNLGMISATNALKGGSMDTEKYYWIMQSNAMNFKIAGIILSGFGGILTIYTGHKLLHE